MSRTKGWAKALGLLAAAPLWCAAATFQVDIDTTPLDGIDGYLAFDLVGGSVAMDNVVSIAAFTSTALLGDAVLTGNATGSLQAPPVTLSSTGSFFNELLQQVTFRARTTSFTLTTTSNYVPGEIPDSFSFFLLGSDFAPFATSDPTGADALFAIDLAGSVTPLVFTSDSATASVVSVVPEPSTALFWLLGLGALAAGRAIQVSRQLP